MHTLRAESPSRKSEGDSVRRVVNARKSRKPDECGTSFQSSPKINRMFIARLICNTMKVYITRPVSLTIEVLLIKIVLFFRPLKKSLVSKLSTLSSDRIRGPTSSGKARDLSPLSLYAWLSSRLDSIHSFHGVR